MGCGSLAGVSSWAAVAALKPIPEELRRVPEVLWGKRVLLAGVIAAFVLVPWTWGPSSQLLASYAVVWAMVGVSLVVLTGWSGHMSLGQFGIAGVSAMVAANMTEDRIAVIIGGNSIMNGSGQGAGNIWTKHLQQFAASRDQSGSRR